MHRSRAKIKVPGKVRRRHIPREGVHLHLFIATLYRIGTTLCDISKLLSVIKKRTRSSRLASYEQYVIAPVVIIPYRALQYVSDYIARSTRWIAQALPGNALQEAAKTTVYAKDRCRIQGRG
jgi:hypothetical protein